MEDEEGERERRFQKRRSEPKGMVWTEVYL